MKIHLLFWTLILFSVGTKAQNANLKIEWELLTNFPTSTYRSEAEFKIINNGEMLGDSNWVIYFSMHPITVKSLKAEQLLDIKHINGDWFKLFPKKGFSLKPGENITFKYGGSKQVIKEGLGPAGLYIVFNDDQGKETRMANLIDYTIRPFSRKEQLMRGKAEGYQPYSLDQVYKDNENLSKVPSQQITPLIPTPFHYTRGSGKLKFTDGLSLMYSPNLKFEANYLSQKVQELVGKKLKLNNRSKAPGIQLGIDKTIFDGKAESYALIINEKGIRINGTDAAGVFYGVQSFLSLLASSESRANLREISYINIKDKPRFSFRSLHLDVSRNFQTKEAVFKTLDIISHYKLNNFLFYISEDEGWRLEIPGLPELTEVGSKRLHPANGKEEKGVMPAYGSGAFSNEKSHGTGYYTRKDFIEILKYAKERHINVIPELNFPGHARAAIIAMENRYERFMKLGKEKEADEYRLIDPLDKSEYLSPQLFKDDVVNISRESSYRFYEKVIDEFTSMYKEAGIKLKKIHAGGDEVAKGAWSGSPEVKKWASDRGVKMDFMDLQAAFFKELVDRMEKKGLEIHGWEEVVILPTEDKKFAPNPEFVNKKVVPYIWNNEYSYPDMGYRLANMGYDVVLCNVTNLYFDLAYSNDPKEPGLIWAGFVDTKKAWGFAPMQFQNSTLINRLGKPVFLDKNPSNFEKLKPEARDRIRGVQAQLWSETILGADMLEYYLLPKLIGFSETAWGKERAWESVADREKRIQNMDQAWNLFANGIGKNEFSKLSKWNGGYNYRIPQVGVRKENGMLKANIAFPGLDIRYTNDGSTPNRNSMQYLNPIKDNGQITFKGFAKEK